MAQIRKDMKSTKRLFSGDTDVSCDGPQGENDEHCETTPPGIGFEAQKENRFPDDDDTQKTALSRSSVSRRSKIKNSPRRRSRQYSASEHIQHDLANDLANLSMSSDRLLEQFPQPPINVISSATSTIPATVNGNPNSSPHLLVPPNGEAPLYPSSSIRSGRNEDLTRFVSSSTTSGTTLTAGSAASFVKHPGPKQLRYIGPNDVPTLPDRVGKMVFDKVSMKWVKDTGAPEVSEDQAKDRQVAADGENDSEDPFRDIESLREEDSSGQRGLPGREDVAHYSDAEDDVPKDLEQSRIEEIDTETETEDTEEAELHSFSFDGPATDSANLIDRQHELDDTDTEDDQDEDLTATTRPTASHEYAVSEDSDVPYDDRSELRYEVETVRQHVPPSADGHIQFGTPQPGLRVAPPTPIIRSAMKSSSVTPMSAMKDPESSRHRTPANRIGHRRSVSFSDGKRDGPIIGIGRNVPTPDIVVDDASPLSHGADRSSAVLVPSARSKRIADMLDNLEDEGNCIAPTARDFLLTVRCFQIMAWILPPKHLAWERAPRIH